MQLSDLDAWPLLPAMDGQLLYTVHRTLLVCVPPSLTGPPAAATAGARADTALSPADGLFASSRGGGGVVAVATVGSQHSPGGTAQGQRDDSGTAHVLQNFGVKVPGSGMSGELGPNSPPVGPGDLVLPQPWGVLLPALMQAS